MEVQLWGKPLFINIDPDGWRVGGVWNTYEEAEEAAKNSILNLKIIRIQ